MASVYAASDAKGNHVAIKMLHPVRSALPGLKEKFLREGYAANAVGHPGVVRALDEGVADDGSAFLVMELVDGETLEAHWIRRGRRLQAGEVLYIVDRVLDILEAAHGVGVLHRDVKPENVMLTRDGVVKLLDFGIANLPEPPRSRRDRTSLTGLTMGTPAFMAPEQVRASSGEIDGRADLWALGATMFLLLSGKHVHVASSLQEQVTAAATRDAPSLRESMPFAAPSLIDLVDRALAFRLEERWQSTSAMRTALRKAASELGELVDKWDIELPPASISSRPIPLSLRPGDLSSVVDPRTPTLPTFALLEASGNTFEFLQTKRGRLVVGAFALSIGVTSLGLWSAKSPASTPIGSPLRQTDALSPATAGAASDLRSPSPSPSEAEAMLPVASAPSLQAASPQPSSSSPLPTQARPWLKPGAVLPQGNGG
ncbi:MAG: serine/threonine protein kinase [Polyangiaceae bacterium]|nr:serine/threonine protein kinase [Polyangiaceae bacterium]